MDPFALPMIATLKHRAPSLLQSVAWLLIASGIGVWGALLLAPEPIAAPAQLAPGNSSSMAPDDVIRWFGSGRGQLQVDIVGLISAGPRGTALLSVGGAPARAFRQGDLLAPGAILDAVKMDGIAIDLDGVQQTIAAPRPAAAAAGFEAVSNTAQ